MSDANADLLERAIELQHLGFSVIPLKSDKKPPIRWKEYQERTATEQEIRDWHERFKPAAYAEVTGAISRQVVIDFDGAAGEDTYRNRFSALTTHGKTPSGGRHVHVAHPGFRVRTLNHKTSGKAPWSREFPGTDIKGDGGYAAVIGEALSKAEPGVLRRYEIVAPIEQSEPWDRLPADFRKYFEPKPTLERLIQRALEQAPSGRNNAGAWLATQARDNGYSENETLEAALRYHSQCGPYDSHGKLSPYTEAEVRATVKSIFSRPPRGPWSAATNSQAEKAKPGRPKRPSFAESTFEVTDAGVFALPKESAQSKIWVCAPLFIRARTSDEQSENHGRLLEWVDDNGSRHRWAMPMEALAGDDSEVRGHLLNGGLKLAPGSDARKLLSLYLQVVRPDKHITCATAIGWHGGSFVLPEIVIPHASNVIYQSAESEHALRTAGALEQWREHIGRSCSGNTRLLLVVSAAFAGPLLSLLRMESGGLHLVGPTSLGKTTVLHAGGSVLGGGTPNGFLRGWRNTANGLEAIAAAHNDLTLLLDELAAIDGREANDVAYMLANGAGKGRMNRTIQLRKRHEWSLLFVSSGELTLRDHAAAAGRHTRGGADIRILNVPADAGKGLGIFEHLHGIETPDRFARQLREAALTYYGTPLRAFLERLCGQREQVVERARSYREKFRVTVPAESAGEVMRAVDRFAIVGFAGELATSFNITGWSEGEATFAAERCFHAWLTLRGTAGGFDAHAAIKQVRLFIEQHGNSRFQSTRVEMRSVPAGESGTTQVAIPPRPVMNRAGFRNEAADGTVMEYLVFPETFRTELCRGFDHTEVAAELHCKGLLKKDDPGHWTVRRSVPQLEERSRFFAIAPEILER